jgi:hypothetical protein
VPRRGSTGGDATSRVALPITCGQSSPLWGSTPTSATRMTMRASGGAGMNLVLLPLRLHDCSALGSAAQDCTRPQSRSPRPQTTCLAKAANRSRLSRGLTAPHFAWKKSAFAFVCYAVPFPIGRVRRKGGSISRALKPLVAAAIRVIAAVAVWMGHVVGVCVMSTRVCHSTRSSKGSKRHEERDLGFGHHDGSLFKIYAMPGTFRRASSPRAPVAGTILDS